MQSMNPKGKWEKLSVELPPGWHETMQKISELCGEVPLKYLYAIAIDQFLSNGDLAAIEEAAWDMHRKSRKECLENIVVAQSGGNREAIERATTFVGWGHLPPISRKRSLGYP